MKIERHGASWVIVDGVGATLGRWRLEGDRVLLSRVCWREREVPPEDVPLQVAVALLASRAAARFVTARPGDMLYGHAALTRWPAALREGLLRTKLESGGASAGWDTFRATFEAVVEAENADEAPSSWRISS